MARTEVNGVQIEYEIIGNGSRSAIITPGGRFAKTMQGVKELAEELAKNDYRVLIWDRPNCGLSDICFEGETESKLNADVAAGLLRQLNMAPALVIGGSAGSRVSLLIAVRHPDVVERLVILWMTGGVIGVMGLGSIYYHDTWYKAQFKGGMQNVVEMLDWKPFCERDPRNRDYLLAWDPKAFRDRMVQWARSFIPDETTPMPDLTPADLRALKIPVMVYRSGEWDPHHTREASEWVAKLIPNSRLVEPPWGDREWIVRTTEAEETKDHTGLFKSWPMMAPQILEFAQS